MARKPPYKHIPREDRPEFQALVAQLEGLDPAEFPARARALVERHHDAVLAGDIAELDATHDGYEALVYVLNGNTLFGSMADENSAGHVLARAVAATPGQVPRWGQMGEFLLEVNGMRIRVKVREGLGNHRSIDLNAVDMDKPFLSETGYRHHGVTATSHLGETFDQAVRRAVIALIEGEGKPKAIKADAFALSSPKPQPKWLADALAGIMPDGQLAMFGDAPESDKPKAKSNAERQREFRKRQAEQKKQAAQQGLRTVLLPKDAVAYLWCAVDVYWTVRKDLDHRGTACVREWLEPVFRGARWFKGAESFDQLGEDSAVLVTEKHRESERKRGWTAYHDECERNTRRVDQLNAMQQELAALKRENALLESERNKSLGAVKVFEARLRNAKLSTDYRPQPGE